MRVADYMHISGRDLRRQPVRSFLTFTALAISTAIVVTLGSLSLGAQQAIVTAMSPDSSLTTIMVTSNKTGTSGLFGKVQIANAESTTLTDASVAQLQALPHVQFASPRAHVWEFNTLGMASDATQFIAQAEAIGPETDRTMPLAAGRTFTPDSAAHEVIIGAAYARELGYEHTPTDLIGKKIVFTTHKGYRGEGASIPKPMSNQATLDTFKKSTMAIEATVVGVTTTGSNQSSVFVPLEWGRQVRVAQYWEGPNYLKKIDQLAEAGYTSVIVRAETTETVPAVSEAIDDLGFGQISTLSMVERLMAFSTVMWVILGAVALVALIAASLGIVNTMLMMVAEQRYVIGVWRASGATRAQIAVQFLLQAVLLGAVGGLLGAGIGFVISQFVNQRIAEMLQAQNLAVIHIPAAPWWLLTGSVVLTVFFAVLAGLYPSWAAARQDPSKSLAGV